MPDCSENYENEITDGKNVRNIKCKYCNSCILTPYSASFASFEVGKVCFSVSLCVNPILVSASLNKTEQVMRDES